MTNRCFSQEKIEAFHDGMLDSSEMNSIQLHLDECCECREALRDLQEMDRRTCEAYQSVSASEPWLAELRKDIASLPAQAAEAQPPQLPFASDNTKRYFAYAAAAAILLALLFIVKQPLDRFSAVSSRPEPNNGRRATVDSQSPTLVAQPDPLPTVTPTVLPQDGVLVAKHSEPHAAFEVYWVLPTQTSQP